MAFFPDADKIIRDPLKEQFSGIMSQFPSKGGISPLYESAVENWNPTAFRNYVAQASNMLTGAAGSANPDWPGLKGGIHVSPLAKDPSDFQKVDWARTFQHELMHPRWEYEKKDPVLSKYGVGVGRNKPNFAFGDEATSATNPGYAGEEQWNYMHDLMYGPRYDIMGDLDEKGPETLVAGDQLRARGLIEPGVETYTPKAHDVIAKSGLTSEMKKALGFGVNPFEDTRAAGIYGLDKDDDETGIIDPSNPQLNKAGLGVMSFLGKKFGPKIAAFIKNRALSKVSKTIGPKIRKKGRDIFNPPTKTPHGGGGWKSPSGRDHVGTSGIGSAAAKSGPAGGSVGASRFR